MCDVKKKETVTFSNIYAVKKILILFTRRELRRMKDHERRKLGGTEALYNGNIISLPYVTTVSLSFHFSKNRISWMKYSGYMHHPRARDGVFVSSDMLFCKFAKLSIRFTVIDS